MFGWILINLKLLYLRYTLKMLEQLEREDRIGSICTNFYCAPTEYSHRRTMEVDAPEILDRCRQDNADIALLVPL